jgi:hypothetical protein
MRGGRDVAGPTTIQNQKGLELCNPDDRGEVASYGLTAFAQDEGSLFAPANLQLAP